MKLRFVALILAILLILPSIGLALTYEKTAANTDYFRPQYSGLELKEPAGNAGIPERFTLTAYGVECSAGTPSVRIYGNGLLYADLALASGNAQGKSSTAVWDGRYRVPGTSEYAPAADGKYSVYLACSKEQEETGLQDVTLLNNGYYADIKGKWRTGEFSKAEVMKADAKDENSNAQSIAVAQLPAFRDRRLDPNTLSCSQQTQGQYCKKGDTTIIYKDTTGSLNGGVFGYLCSWSADSKKGFALCSARAPALKYSNSLKVTASGEYETTISVGTDAEAYYKILLIRPDGSVEKREVKTAVKAATFTFFLEANSDYVIFISALGQAGGASLEKEKISTPAIYGVPISREDELEISLPKTAVTTNSATVTWKTNIPADSRIKIDNTGQTSSVLVSDHSLTATGLNEDEFYSCYLFSKDGQGREASAACDFTTAKTVDNTAPQVTAKSVTADTDTATITWSTDEASATLIGADPNKTLILQKNSLDGLLSKTYTQAVWVDWTRTTEHTYTAYGLNPGTEYWYVIFTEDGAGNSRFTAASSFKTVSVPIEKKPNLIVSAVTFDPAFPYEGDNVTVTADVTNTGDAAAILPGSKRMLDLFFNGRYTASYNFAKVVVSTVSVKTTRSCRLRASVSAFIAGQRWPLAVQTNIGH